MIEIQKEVLAVLVIFSFLAGVLVTALIILTVMLKGISKRLQNPADKMKGGLKNA